MNNGLKGPLKTVQSARFLSSERLKLKKDFQDVYQFGKRFATKHLIVYVKDGEQAQVQVAFVTGRKVGAAHHRNRIRRIMREAYRKMKNEFQDGFRFIFIAKSQVDPWRFIDVQQEMSSILNKISKG
ncbi:MAG: ribonuclease P protein component [Chlamydiota bacterium]|nr:ribonuclease P protein component [Chlamydiota bacterium]